MVLRSTKQLLLHHWNGFKLMKPNSYQQKQLLAHNSNYLRHNFPNRMLIEEQRWANPRNRIGGTRRIELPPEKRPPGPRRATEAAAGRQPPWARRHRRRPDRTTAPPDRRWWPPAGTIQSPTPRSSGGGGQDRPRRWAERAATFPIRFNLFVTL